MAHLNESAIPADVLPQARAWFGKEMARLEKLHGDKWPDHREWLADYLNAELMERVERRAHESGARA
jgi:hypothetical protein